MVLRCVLTGLHVCTCWLSNHLTERVDCFVAIVLWLSVLCASSSWCRGLPAMYVCDFFDHNLSLFNLLCIAKGDFFTNKKWEMNKNDNMYGCAICKFKRYLCNSDFNSN